MGQRKENLSAELTDHTFRQAVHWTSLMEGHVSFPGFSTNHNKVEQTEGQEIVYKQVTGISCQTYSKTSYLTKKDYFFIILKEGSRENYSASLT